MTVHFSCKFSGSQILSFLVHASINFFPRNPFSERNCVVSGIWKVQDAGKFEGREKEESLRMWSDVHEWLWKFINLCPNIYSRAGSFVAPEVWDEGPREVSTKSEALWLMVPYLKRWQRLPLLSIWLSSTLNQHTHDATQTFSFHVHDFLRRNFRQFSYDSVDINRCCSNEASDVVTKQ